MTQIALKDEHKCIKTVFSLFEFYFICRFIRIYKIIKIHIVILNSPIHLYYNRFVSNVYDTNRVERLTQSYQNGIPIIRVLYHL
jgi:hypothetical protein